MIDRVLGLIRAGGPKVDVLEMAVPSRIPCLRFYTAIFVDCNKLRIQRRLLYGHQYFSHQFISSVFLVYVSLGYVSSAILIDI